MAKVSVVIPLYNKEKYIKETLLSVLNQTFNDFEVIIVDDGSTDNSAAIISSFNDDRIKVIFQKNAGETAARNKGVKIASTEYIAFLDADDFWKPDFLQELWKLKEAFINVSIYASAYNNISFSLKGKCPKNIITFKDYLNMCCKFKKSPLNSSSIMMRKSAIEKVGGFPVGQKRGGDLDTWYRLLEQFDCAYTNKSLSIYNQGLPDSVCKNILVVGEGPLLKKIEQKIKNNYYQSNQIASIKTYLAWRRLLFINAILDQNQWQKYLKPLFINLLKSRYFFGDYIIRILRHVKRQFIK